MSDHLYSCGQHVAFTSKHILGRDWTGPFTITRLLPSGGEEPRYEIKNSVETYSRVAFEHQLSARSESVKTFDI